MPVRPLLQYIIYSLSRFVVDVIFTSLPDVPDEMEAAAVYIEELTLLSSN